MDLKPNTLTLIGLCREYCSLIENAGETDPRELTARLVKILPRIYISATDLEHAVVIEEDDDSVGLDSYLEEDYYEALRLKLENIFGPDDVYLEVFEREMRYSDTPVRASLAEGLCDLYQEFYNFTESIRGALSDELLGSVLNAMGEEFKTMWSQTLVNLMRPLNALANKTLDDDEADY